MTSLPRLLRPMLAVALCSSSLLGRAQGPAPRLAAGLGGASRATLTGSKSPHALAANDLGALPVDTTLKGVTLVFKRSAAQETALQELLAAQQTPGSPQFHQWLTPDQFAQRFGVADSDIATVETWLEAQGFTIDRVARSRDRLSFSGTAGMVDSAFGADLHQYREGGVTHFAPSTSLSLPAALASMVSAVTNLSDFRPKPQVRFSSTRPELTSGATQAHFLDPLDVATQYDVNSLYTAGYTGAGQSIAVVGQSYINTADISTFGSALGVSLATPQLVLVPSSGISATVVGGDEAEADIDTEYSSAMAHGATIDFVYVGDSVNYSVYDAVGYAISEDIAPIISISYGSCEQELSVDDINSFGQVLEEGNAQGQTVVTASGDSGSTNCATSTGISAVQQQSPSADFPAVLASATGIGGLELQSGTYATGDTQYFSPASGSDTLSSLLSYVPETVWNEDTLGQGVLAGGGGVSQVVARPTWQAGVPGIAAGTFRLVPDIALQASITSPGYVYCTSDPGGLATNQASSCTNGLRDSSTGDYTVAGGTSFSAPIFAGMLAVLNQATGSLGQGNINPTLYTLASNSATYAAAFHDITTGGNQCTAGTTYCSAAGQAVYAAGTGYDEASGLGSVDLAKLVSVWPKAATSALTPTTATVALTGAATAGATDQATIAVTDAAGITPTGTVTLALDGTVLDTALTLSSGTTTASVAIPANAVNGSHVLVATYNGDNNTAPSRGTAVVTLGNTLPSGTFTVAATAVTLNYNSTGSGTVTVTPGSGYGGLVNFSLSGDTSLDICYSISPVSTDPSATPYTSTLSLGEGNACNSTNPLVHFGTGAWHLLKANKAATTSQNRTPHTPSDHWPAPVALAGLLVGAWGLRRRGRNLPAVLGLTLLIVAGFGLSGCGSNSGSSTTPPVTVVPQTITLTVTGTDSIETGISSSTTFQLHVQ